MAASQGARWVLRCWRARLSAHNGRRVATAFSAVRFIGPAAMRFRRKRFSRRAGKGGLAYGRSMADCRGGSFAAARVGRRRPVAACMWGRIVWGPPEDCSDVSRRTVARCPTTTTTTTPPLQHLLRHGLRSVPRPVSSGW